jgi:hypothetical protein
MYQLSHWLQGFSFFRPPPSVLRTVSNYSELNPNFERRKTEEKRRKTWHPRHPQDLRSYVKEFSFFRPPSSVLRTVSNYSELTHTAKEEKRKKEEGRLGIRDPH